MPGKYIVTGVISINTPIYDFVRDYCASGAVRFHMPGHKGISHLGCEPYDITEIAGADALYEASTIIAESEKNASEIFGFGHNYYSTEGSSQCIKAMLYLALQHAISQGVNTRTVLAARNVHKSFIHACALLDLVPEWIYPEDGGNSLCSCYTTAGAVAEKLRAKKEKPIAVYLTAPDYLGYSPDIKAIADVCKISGVPLLVDNAHGAYLKFLPESRHPVDLGAFMSSDSAHKTLPVLTGGAYLQLSADVPDNIAASVKDALALFGSTSPSYLILQSLDLCNRYIAEGYRERLAEFIKLVDGIKKKISAAGWEVFESDPLKIVIGTKQMGYTGRETAEALRRHGFECEFADLFALVLMVTPDNTEDELERFCGVLKELPEKVLPQKAPLHSFPRNRRAVSVREAFVSQHEIIPAEKSVGHVCASTTVSCPPAVPVVVSGEVISEDCVTFLKAYGIDFVDVII